MKKLPLFPSRHGKPREIEVAPGATIADLPPQDVRRVAVCDMIPQGDHTYKAVARLHQEEARLTPATLRELGIGIGMRTMSRLVKAGFVEGARVAPQLYTFKIHSYYEHVAKVREAAAKGDEFWTKERLELYRSAI